jgi:hypothetical protein
MNLKARTHVQRQKATAQEKLSAHLNLLKEKGLEDEVIKRNANVRKLTAELAKANFRLARIAAQDKLNQERAQARIDKLAAAQAAKAAGDAEAGGKGKKKAKKEKQAKPEGKAKAKPKEKKG